MVDDARDFVGPASIGPASVGLSVNVASKCQVLLAVLAAGASRRLGQPKQLVRLDGEPLVRRQCRIAIESQLGSVWVVVGRDANECTTVISDLPVVRKLNERWSEGLSSSIHLAAQAAIENNVGGLLLMHVDQYRVTPADLQSLYSAWKDSPKLICVAGYGDGFGPPVIFPRNCFAKLLELEGDSGARRVINSLPADSVRQVSMPNGVHDLDEPSQLATLLATGAWSATPLAEDWQSTEPR